MRHLIRLVSLFCFAVPACSVLSSPNRFAPRAGFQEHGKNALVKLWSELHDRYVYFEVKQDLSELRHLADADMARVTSRREYVIALARTLSRLNDPHVMFVNLPEYWQSTTGSTLYSAHVEEASIGGRYFVRFQRTDTESARLQGLPLQEFYELESVEGIKASAIAHQLLWGQLDEQIPVGVIAIDGTVHSFVVHVHEHTPAGPTISNVLPESNPQLPQVVTSPIVPTRWGDVGWIAVSQLLDANIPELFDAALDALMDTRSLVIDLRTNSGGTIENVSKVVGRFVDTPVAYAYIQHRSRVQVNTDEHPIWYTESLYALPRPPTYRKPIVVLIDTGTVSAAETLASGLKDVCDAVLVGNRTQGGGAAINEMPLPDGLIVQYSIKPVIRLNHTSLQYIGLPPDVSVEFDRAALCSLGTTQLLRYLQDEAQVARTIAAKRATTYSGPVTTRPVATQP